MIELAKEQEKVILVGVSLPGQEDTGQLLDELAFLADTAGAREVGRVIQSRDQIHPGTYVGTGKIMEIKDLLWETDASGIICDDELSPAQMKNLEDELDSQGAGPDPADPGYLCGQGPYQRGEDPGGAGAA